MLTRDVTGQVELWSTVALDAVVSSLSLNTPAIVVISLSILLWTQGKLEKQQLMVPGSVLLCSSVQSVVCFVYVTNPLCRDYWSLLLQIAIVLFLITCCLST